jgi:hypothetical protein
MARQPMPKALSPLQSDQRSYTSEFSVVSPVAVEWESCWSSLRSCWRGELVSWYPREEEGNLEFADYQGYSGYDDCGFVVIYAVVSCKTEGVRRDSIVIDCEVQ